MSDHHADPEPSEDTESKPWGVVCTVVIVLAVLALLMRGCSCSSSKPTVGTSPPTTAEPQVQQLIQVPDKFTPCEIDIQEIHDIYTDGEPVWSLPPGWPESKKIYYPGKGHLVIRGASIHPGVWKFWSADTNKVVLVRIFKKK